MSHSSSIWNALSRDIAAATGVPFTCRRHTAVGGGCINSAYIIEDHDIEYFVKLNEANREDMFAAEYAGLNEIVNSHTISAPKPVCFGVTGTRSYIIMERIKRGAADKDTYVAFGRQLADMHRINHTQYGWHCANTIGSTPQINPLSDNWIEFWSESRLGYQLQLAARNGYGRHLAASGERLLERLPVFFINHTPSPSLLHGDLWSGNYTSDMDGNPYIFDPAVYYGDRETDIAMTELFGGFPAQFYRAYEEAYPLEQDYRVRKKLYNLYHILNHLNLFGEAYMTQAREMINGLVSEAG